MSSLFLFSYNLETLPPEYLPESISVCLGSPLYLTLLPELTLAASPSVTHTLIPPPLNVGCFTFLLSKLCASMFPPELASADNEPACPSISIDPPELALADTLLASRSISTSAPLGAETLIALNRSAP